MSGSSNHHTDDPHSPMDCGLASPTSERVLQCVLGSVLFERFCFFLLISVLVLYLNERRGYSAPHAVQLYSMFVSGCYLMPLIGGQLCDGRLGSGRTSLLGMAIQSVGFLLFAVLDSDFTAISLALIAFGAGLFKAGTQTLVGGLFSSADPKRDRAFGTVYVVVNVAALVAPILGGIVQTWECYRVLFALLVASAVLGCVCLLPASWSAFRPLRPPSTEVGATNSESSCIGAKLALDFYRLALSLRAAFGAGSHSTLLLFVRDHTDRHVGTVEGTTWLRVRSRTGGGRWYCLPCPCCPSCSLHCEIATESRLRSARWPSACSSPPWPSFPLRWSGLRCARRSFGKFALGAELHGDASSRRNPRWCARTIRNLANCPTSSHRPLAQLLVPGHRYRKCAWWMGGVVNLLNSVGRRCHHCLRRRASKFRLSLTIPIRTGMGF